MTERPSDRRAGLPWPEAYLDLQPRVRKEWVIEDIYLIRTLGAGKSGALVYVCDVTGQKFAGQAILKFDQAPERPSEATEFERHRRALEVEPDYAARHLPLLVHGLRQGDEIAQLATIAGRGLEYAVPLVDCAFAQQQALARRVSAGLLEQWNRGYRLAEGLQDPPALLARWLGHRLDPTAGRIRRFLAEECGLSAADHCVIFEGEWQPNPLSFADGVVPLPEKLHLRAATGQLHGDLNGWNVLSVARPGARGTYYLIDLALYEDDQYLFYDHAYLELAYLLHVRENVDAPHWQSILDHLMRFRSPATGAGARAEDVGLLKIVAALRREVLGWIDRHEPHRLAQLESQYLLARVAVGLNFTHKALPREKRCMAFLYAAANLKDYLKLHDLDWPKHGPAFGFEQPASAVTAGVLAASAPALHPPLPHKPSIAVLPFDNLSGDPEQEYLADGITEEIITELSRVDWLMVISRGSSFTYKHQKVDMRQVGRELGVRYLVEGSVRKAGGRVRVTAQLLDANGGHHLWAQRYDRELEDIFALQDEIAEAIAASIDTELKSSERQHSHRKHPPYNAWDRYQQGLWHFFRRRVEDASAARRHIHEALKLEPQFAQGYSVLALLDLRKIQLGLEKHPDKVLAKAFEDAVKAVSLDEHSSLAHTALGRVYSLQGNHDRAVAECELAVELNPSSSVAYLALGGALVWGGRAAEALPRLEMSMRLSPRDPLQWMRHLAMVFCQYALGDLSKAEEHARQAQHGHLVAAHSSVILAATLAAEGRPAEARTAIGQALELRPDFSIPVLAQAFTGMQRDLADKLLRDAERAGLPLD